MGGKSVNVDSAPGVPPISELDVQLLDLGLDALGVGAGVRVGVGAGVGCRPPQATVPTPKAASKKTEHPRSSMLNHFRPASTRPRLLQERQIALERDPVFNIGEGGFEPPTT